MAIRLTKANRKALYAALAPTLEPTDMRQKAEQATDKYINHIMERITSAVDPADVPTLRKYDAVTSLKRIGIETEETYRRVDENGVIDIECNVSLLHPSNRDYDLSGLENIDHLPRALSFNKRATSSASDVEKMVSGHPKRGTVWVKPEHEVYWTNERASSLSGLRVPAPDILVERGTGKKDITRVSYTVRGGWHTSMPHSANETLDHIVDNKGLKLFGEAHTLAADYWLTYVGLLNAARKMINRTNTFDKLVEQWPEIEQYRSVVEAPPLPALTADVDPNMLSRLRAATRV